jgi:hypothetical protein
MPQQINLIDESLRPVRQRLPASALLATLAVASSLLATHYMWEKWSLARALSHAVVPPPAVSELATDTATQAREEARLAQREALRDLLRLQVSVAEGSASLLGDIIGAMPENMWLTELEVGAARTLKIGGGIANSASFGLFSSRLEHITALKNLPVHTVRLGPRVLESAGSGPERPAPEGRLFLIAGGASDDTASDQKPLAASGAKP